MDNALGFAGGQYGSNQQHPFCCPPLRWPARNSSEFRLKRCPRECHHHVHLRRADQEWIEIGAEDVLGGVGREPITQGDELLGRLIPDTYMLLAVETASRKSSHTMSSIKTP